MDHKKYIVDVVICIKIAVMKIKICLAGATGKMGSHLAKAISESKDLEIISALAKNYNTQNLGDV